MSSKSEYKPSEDHRQETETHSLRACLVEGDSAQRMRDRRRRQRALLISVTLQITVLAALILVPILSRTERIALANVMPLPPYYHPVASAPIGQHQARPVPTRGFHFCLTCPPVVPITPARARSSGHASDGVLSDFAPDGDGRVECAECVGLLGNRNAQPAIPRPPTPAVVHVGHLDPAMLLHRVDPVYPTLPRQMGREGTVELHAIIATDGSVRSLQFVEGDPLFYQSALEAVRQWRYKPTFLNGNPVEVDTRITVIYRLNH